MMLRTAATAGLAAMVGAYVGTILANRHARPAVVDPEPEQQRFPWPVTNRQVRAAQVAVRAYELAEMPIPPGLRNLADARPEQISGYPRNAGVR